MARCSPVVPALLLVVAALGLGGFFIWLRFQEAAPAAAVATVPVLPPSRPATPLIAPATTATASAPAVEAPAAPPPAPKVPRPLVVQGVYNPPPLEGPNAAELTRIDDLAVTYDAREVPALAAFLTHDSAEVRAAAIDGLLRLGAKEAAEPLRAAAAKTKDPREAVALLDAAAYLELPPMPASMRSKLKAAKTTATPSPAPSEPKKTTALDGG